MAAVIQGSYDGLVSNCPSHVTSAKEEVLRHTWCLSSEPRLGLKDQASSHRETGIPAIDLPEQNNQDKFTHAN